jgi:peptidoglycan/LPS O-acetylase OafA/YrhL
MQVATHKEDIAAIPLLRWFAASLITIVHSQHELLKLADRHHTQLRFHNIVEFGVGVDVFFVISGFLMHYVSRGGFHRRGQSLDFLRRRFIRVVPLYWLATIGMLVAILLVPRLLNHSTVVPLNAVMTFLMVAWPDSEGRLAPLLNNGWTLNLEIYFYLVFAAVLRFREATALALLALWFAGTVLLAQLWPGAGWASDFYGQPMVLEFVLGVAFSVLYTRGLRIGPRLGLALAVAAVLLHLGVRHSFAAPRLIANGLPAALLFFAAVFCRGFRLPGRLDGFSRLMGDASYALYLTSPFVINVVSEVLDRLHVASHGVLIAASYLASVAVAVLVYRCVERPMTRFGRRLLDRREAAQAPATASGATMRSVAAGTRYEPG